jgi:hypothetical protein
LFNFFPQNRVIEICQAAGDTTKWPIKKGSGGNLFGKLNKHWEDGVISVKIDRALSLEEEAGLQVSYIKKDIPTSL